MDRAPPSPLKCKLGNTTVATKMGRYLAMKNKTTRESGRHTDPSKHDLTKWMQYRHIHVHAPPKPLCK